MSATTIITHSLAHVPVGSQEHIVKLILVVIILEGAHTMFALIMALVISILMVEQPVNVQLVSRDNIVRIS